MTKNKKIKITLIKSPIGYKQKAKRTVEALGLKKLNQSIEHNQNESIKGMIKTIDYLIKVEEI
jgi:large subunit ribosomal protein L30|tara:strand:- start:398 stop:586 length:189 start_codon:yes stop_codon:yes gene_type:complete